MLVKHNICAINTYNQLNIVEKTRTKNMEKLSSGYKINRAADDAAGLSISEKMRKQIRGLTRGIENTEDGISFCQVADGALAEVSEMLIRLEQLTVQAANGTNSEPDRNSIQQEVNQLLSEIDRISETTSFNEKKIFLTDTVIENDLAEYIKSAFVNSQTSSSNQNSKTDEEIIHEMLRDGTYSIVNTDIQLADGQVIDRVSANEILGCLSAYTCVYEISKLPGYDPTNDNTLLKTYFSRMYNVADGLSKYSGNQRDYNRLNGNAINLFNTTIATNGPKSNFTTMQYAYSDAYHCSPVDGTNNDIAARMADALCELCCTQKPGGGASFFKDSQGAINMATMAILRKSGITSGNVTNFFSSYPTTADSIDTVIESYKYIFGVQKNIDVSKNYGYSSKSNEVESLETWIQSGAEKGSGLYIKIDPINTNILGIDKLNVLSEEAATESIDLVGNAQIILLTNRSKIGAYQNRLEHIIKNESNIVENTVKAESQIRDTDMANEMLNFSIHNILSQAGQSMLAQANQSNQGVLSLLQ